MRVIWLVEGVDTPSGALGVAAEAAAAERAAKAPAVSVEGATEGLMVAVSGPIAGSGATIGAGDGIAAELWLESMVGELIPRYSTA